MKEGDVLEHGPASAEALRRLAILEESAGAGKFSAARWYVSPEILPPYRPDPTLRVMVGEEFEQFTPSSREKFLRDSFQVTNESDRMGYRLSGGGLRLTKPVERISEPTACGAIQAPPDGNMIVLLADRQTVGGYPKVAHVAAVDLPVIAQVKPGESIRFREIGLGEAQELYCQRERQLWLLKCAVALRD